MCRSRDGDWRAVDGFPEPVLLAFGAKTNYLIGYDRIIGDCHASIHSRQSAARVINMYSLWVIVQGKSFTVGKVHGVLVVTGSPACSQVT